MISAPFWIETEEQWIGRRLVKEVGREQEGLEIDFLNISLTKKNATSALLWLINIVHASI